MIQSNSLMIGNWLLHRDKAKQVGSIHSDNTVRFILDDVRTEGCFSLKYVEPIPLTPEILEKISTVSKTADNRYTHWKVNDTRYVVQFDWLNRGEGYTLYEEWEEDMDMIAVDVKTLHRLQNIIFAISEQELTINI